MRNIVIALAAVAVIGLGWLGYSATRTPAEPAGPVATDEAPSGADTQTAAEPATAETPAGEAGPAETVAEESDGTPDSGEAADHNLRLAAEGGAKQSADSTGRFKSGVHYRQLVPTQPKVTGTDKIEVVEVFWYGCGHCFSFDPHIKAWADELPADVEFVRLPAVWNETLRRHARAFYTAEVLASAGTLERPEAFHDAFFQEIHVNRKPLATDRSLKALFERFGVPGDAYDNATESFEVDQKVRTAMDLTRRYGVTGVPALVVNGRYLSLSKEIQGWDDYLELVDALVESER
ncbi:MAG: DsbA family protein [Pseudomonadota bacterium]